MARALARAAGVTCVLSVSLGAAPTLYAPLADDPAAFAALIGSDTATGAAVVKVNAIKLD
jgi:hypothetical protein